jgi:hypothetical protein
MIIHRDNLMAMMGAMDIAKVYLYSTVTPKGFCILEIEDYKR